MIRGGSGRAAEAGRLADDAPAAEGASGRPGSQDMRPRPLPVIQRPARRVRVQLLLALFVGSVTAAALAANAGWGAIAAILARIGWPDFAILCGLQAGATVLCAWAWRLFLPGTSLLACTGARAIRDGAGAILGIVPGIGEVAAVRALTLLGAAATAAAAAAAAIVDLMAEILSQCAFSALGAGALLAVLGAREPGHAAPLLAATLAVALALAAPLGSRRVRTAAGRLLSRFALSFGATAGRLGAEVAREVAAMTGKRGTLAASSLIHLLAWLTLAWQVQVAAAAVGHPLTATAAIAIAGLTCAARGLFFMVPWSVGVHEASFVAAGALVGMDEATALAIALVLRARDVVLSVPALGLWAAAEARAGLGRPFGSRPGRRPS